MATKLTPAATTSGPAGPGRARPVGPARRVQVSWLAGAVALALVVTLLVLWGFGRASERREVLMITAPVTAGQPIPATALGSTFVAVDSSTRLFGVDQRGGLTDRVATVDLAVGDLLGPSMVTAAPVLPAGWVQAGIVLKAGRYPSTIKVGDQMLAASTQPDGGPGVDVLVMKVSVGDDRIATAVVAVVAESGVQVAQWSAADTLVVLLKAPVAA